ncbi:prepilin-type N-terminal cleavage/methylation domain-containing protein [Clostridium sp. UBA5988]|uniref:prepilin-type N-terminal cleavage/methylation domain-containing protein n=1 Tax=Clostridium sp. UBA5988 TaxID=1946369 RepID=UPI00321748A0
MTYKDRIKHKNKGFTLVEVIIVIAIIAILAAIAVPYYIEQVEKAEEKICFSNCKQLERLYKIYLYEKNIRHSDIVFEKFLQDYGNDICPKHSEVNYMDGEVKCSIHLKNDVINDNDDEDVPFL